MSVPGPKRHTYFLRTTHRGPRGPETQVTAKKKMKNIQEPETVDEIDSTRSIMQEPILNFIAIGCLNASSVNLPQENMRILPIHHLYR